MTAAYERPEICTACGGKCCQRMPGCNHPVDFGLPSDNAALLAALRSGNYAIDWWEGEVTGADGTTVQPGYFVRPATIADRGRLYDPSWGGPCWFWAPANGCTLPVEQRPTGCRMLEPTPDIKCISHDGGKLGAAQAWVPFYDLLDNMRERLEETQ